jgi:DNA-binding NarL/FixJ family response regulator
LEHLFQHEPDVREAASATQLHVGAKVAGRLLPDVALVYPRFGGHPPLEVAVAIQERCPEARLVYLDDTVRPSGIQAAVEVGVSGYWTKHADFAELAAAVRQVAAGGISFCPAAARCIRGTPPKLECRRLPTGQLSAMLSPRELEVLVLLARGLSAKQCAKRLNLAPSTIDNHKIRLMQKLGVHKTVALAVLAVREGLLD